MADVDEVRARLGRALPRVHGSVLLRDEWSPGKPLTAFGEQLVDAMLPEVLAMLEEERTDALVDVAEAAEESAEPAEPEQEDEQPETRRRVRRVQ